MKTRLLEFDLVKAILILVMVASHSLEVVFSKGYGDFAFCADSGFSVFVEDFIFLVGPFGFMVTMGALISFVGVREPARQIRRGCTLLLVWFLLNCLRSFPCAVLLARPDGDSLTTLMVRFVFANDILFFAGLFFAYLGVLCRLGLSYGGVMVVSAVLYGISLLLGDVEHLIAPPFRLLTAGWVRTGHLSSFPFLSWAVVPALGMGLGLLLVRFAESRRRLYAVVVGVSAVLLIALLPLLRAEGAFDGAALLAMRGNPLGLHANGLPAFAVSCALFGLFLAGARFVSPCLQAGRLGAVITYLGRNLPLIYFAQWVLIPLIALATRKVMAPLSDAAVAIGCLAVAAASVAVAEGGKRLWRCCHG